MFEQLDCKVMATTSPEPVCVKNVRSSLPIRIIQVPGLAELLAGDYQHYPYAKSYEEAKHEPLVALHTSGSTGKSTCILFEACNSGC